MSDQTICQDCGAIIEESSDLERRPCPQCGSTRRAFDLEIAESFKMYDSLSFQHKDPKKTGRTKIKSEGFSGYEYSRHYQKIVPNSCSLIVRPMYTLKPLPISKRAKSFTDVKSHCHSTQVMERRNRRSLIRHDAA